MKKRYCIFITVVAIATTFSCTKPEELRPSIDEEDVFYASISGDNATKTIVDGMKIKWQDLDCVQINGAEYEVKVVNSDPTQAICSRVKGIPSKEGDFNKAIFPVSLYHSTPEPHYELPSEFEYTGERYEVPMYAQSSTRNLAFHSIFATLKVCLPSNLVLKSLSVTADTYINGKFKINTSYLDYIDYVQAEIEEGSDKNKMTTVIFNPERAGADVYIHVPSDWYFDRNFKFIATCADGTVLNMTALHNAEITFLAGTLYIFDFRHDGYFEARSDRQIGYNDVI